MQRPRHHENERQTKKMEGDKSREIKRPAKTRTPAIAEQEIKTQTFQRFNEPQLSVFQWTSKFAIQSGSQKEFQQRKEG